MSTSDKLMNGILAASSVGALLGSAYVIYKTITEDNEEDKDDSGVLVLDRKPSGHTNAPREVNSSAIEKHKMIQSLDTSFRADEADGRDVSSQIFRICISGGPKSGITTAISKISENLTALGYKVFIVPSCFNLTASSGFNIFDETLPMEDRLQVLITFMKMLMKLEDYFLDMAHDEVDSNVVILYTMGTMDVKARVRPDLWEAMLSEASWAEVTLRGRFSLTFSDKRYDMVMHMTTSAVGAAEFFDDKLYSADEAMQIDKKMNECWNGHAKLVIVKNLPGKAFRDKIAYCMTSVNSLIGLPTKNQYYLKFLLDVDSAANLEFPDDVTVQSHYLTESFLKSSRKEVQIRLSKRVEYFLIKSQNGVNRFVYSCRAPSKVDGERMEMMKQISAQEYMEYKSYIIRDSMEVEKQVYSFICDNTSYQIERFLNTPERPAILRVEGNQEVQQKDLPSFLRVKEEITGSSYLSRKFEIFHLLPGYSKASEK